MDSTSTLGIQLTIPGLESFTTPLLQKIIDTPVAAWLHDQLKLLTSKELTTLCEKFKLSTHGRKLAKIARLLAHANAVKILSAWAESVGHDSVAVGSFFTIPEMKKLCAALGVNPGVRVGNMSLNLAVYRMASNGRGLRFLKACAKLWK